jgi:hypothetical protein
MKKMKLEVYQAMNSNKKFLQFLKQISASDFEKQITRQVKDEITAEIDQ